MKKFKFRYENILKIKYQEEDDILNKISQVKKDRLDQVNQKSKFENDLIEYSHSIKSQISRGCSAHYLNNIQNYKHYYMSNIEEKEKIILEYDQIIELLNIELLEKMKERKTMDKLKEKSYEAFIKEYHYQENKAIEEIVNYKNNKRGD